MDYLLLQILLFLILAAVIGFFIGWITRGLGFESRLLASENQWRTRHHALQSENYRLKSDLDVFKQKQTEAPEKIQKEKAALPLPFSSTQELSGKLSSQDNDTEDHPLGRLRSGLDLIEKEQTKEQSEEQVLEQIEVFTTPSSQAPERLDQPDGEADDLKAIKGIGPKVESTLNSFGIFHFKQLASFTEENINWINEQLQFSGRVEQEEWIAQAQALINNSDQ